MRVDFQRVAELTDKMEKALRAKVERSAGFFERALQVLPAGVLLRSRINLHTPSTSQAAREPRFGTSTVLVHRLPQRLRSDGDGLCPSHHRGMPYGRRLGRARTSPCQPSQRSGWPRILSRRFRLPKVRFTNSGTEATLEAIHLARAFTGRDTIVKSEGSYHGHHDSVMVSVHPDPSQIGPREAPVSVPFTAGIPQAVVDLTLSVPFNDPDALAELLSSRDDVAGVIVEPIMLNIRSDHAERGLSGGAAGNHRAPRSGVDLRRGQDGGHDRCGRCRRTLRGTA